VGALAEAHCNLGVGCDEAGTCYAEVHGDPEQCGRTAREIERLYTLAKANNQLARMNADRATKAEAELANVIARQEWGQHLLAEARSRNDTMYLAKQEAERKVDRVKAALLRRSHPTMDPTYTAAFNAALDMVGRALREDQPVATALKGERAS